ncbi:MAG: rhamnosyltransferase [Betaproteobacteria bacterium]|nr:rhamnosyltransferase [Betaproteobacteria bacterium]
MNAPPAAEQQAYIGALIITFNPDPERLRLVTEAIAPQVAAVLVVDNGSAQDPAASLESGGATPLHLLALGDNYGIAAAQNIGLEWARRQGYSHVLMLDHDAVAAPGMVAQLLDEMRAREARGERVAAVGPLIHDPRRGAPAPFFRVTQRRILRIEAPDPGECSARTDFLIAAGVLISMSALEEVGMMDEALFIDYVDLEWSMRATARGYRLYGHYGTRIDHRLGDEPIRLFGRKMMSHSPLRHYYLARNAVALWRMPHPQWHWKVLDAVNLFVKCGIFSTLAPNRGTHLRMILRGFADGLRGRYGRFDQARRGWRVPDELRTRTPRRL